MTVVIKHCNKCDEDKTIESFSKTGGKYTTICKLCENKRKQAGRAKRAEVNQKIEEVLQVYVPKYVVKKYVPDVVYVRNEGMKHIPSRGLLC